MVNKEEQNLIDKIIIQGKCLEAIKDLEEELDKIRITILANCGIRFSWEDEKQAESRLRCILHEYQNEVKPFEEECI